MIDNNSDLIATAASPTFESSLLALIGSLKVNWPGHPKILVYDLGMTSETLLLLNNLGIEVRSVDRYCSHWRKYFTWRFWCLLDIPAEHYLWLDAGVCCLRPMPEVFLSIKNMGYFCSTNYWSLALNMNERMQHSLGISNSKLENMVSMNAGIHGLRKDNDGINILTEAYEIAKIENNMIATHPLHRHDQPLITALFYKYFQEPLFADFKTYACCDSPYEVSNQKIWVHRRRMKSEDMKYFIDALSENNKEPYLPSNVSKENSTGLINKMRIKIAKIRGRYPIDENCIYQGIRD